MSRLPALSLALAALGFAGFGGTLLVEPGLLALVDIPAATVDARSDLRAFYGGLELGLAAWFALAARRRAWHGLAVRAQVLAFGGLVLGRAVSLLVDGVPRPLTLLFAGAEAAGLLLGLLALRALPAGDAG